jgi:predicted aminopeptidase
VISPAYYAQAVAGHLGVVAKAQPMDDWLAGNDLTDTQKQRLQQAQAMRRFAVDVLGLPNNSSHTRYADLQRNAVVWNVVATPIGNSTA